MERKILYVGGFELPDKNAAAHRVLGNAKALRTIGCEVVFLNYSGSSVFGWTQYEGFRCYQLPKRSIAQQLTSIRDAVTVIRECGITDVIAYNYPAFTLYQIISFCRRKGLKCYADATEWYVAEGNIVFRIIKNTDTWWRMNKLHFQMDGVIAISEYLYQFYKDKVFTVKIPPLTDSVKLSKYERKKNDKTVFLYAGSPSAQKERLDLIIDAITAISERNGLELRIIGITREQYERLYKVKCIEQNVFFLGRLSHQKVIEEQKNSDWSIVIRNNNLVVKAGFPTKVAESISCGTPVIANEFSNIADYLDETNSVICEQDKLKQAIELAMTRHIRVDITKFDYDHYLEQFKMLIAFENG